MNILVTEIKWTNLVTAVKAPEVRRAATEHRTEQVL